MLNLSSKVFSCYGNKSDKSMFSSKIMNKKVLEELTKYRKVLDMQSTRHQQTADSESMNTWLPLTSRQRKDLSIFTRKQVCNFRKTDYARNL